MPRTSNLDRRTVVVGFAAGVAAVCLPSTGLAEAGAPITRKIPSSGEAIPVVGLGTWITFNVGNDPVARDACAEVMRAFFAAGGRMIDSSPMYGSSQAVIGWGLARLGQPSSLFAADKVWASSDGPEQIEQWRVGKGPVGLKAAPLEHNHALFRCIGGRLGDQPRFADPGLARNRNTLTVSTACRC